MNNKMLKEKLMTLVENVDLGLIDPSEVQAYDLDSIVTPDVTVAEILQWVNKSLRVEQMMEPNKMVFIMSLNTYKIIRSLQCADESYAWLPNIGRPSSFLGVPYILKARI